jgi:hypothetical protein
MRVVWMPHCARISAALRMAERISGSGQSPRLIARSSSVCDGIAGAVKSLMLVRCSKRSRSGSFALTVVAKAIAVRGSAFRRAFPKVIGQMVAGLIKI